MSAEGVVMSLVDGWLGVSLLITNLKPFFHFLRAVIAQTNLCRDISVVVFEHVQ